MSDHTELGTQLNGFDTVVAVPQWYLNYNLADRLANGKTSDGKSLKNVSVNVGANPLITGVVSALAVKLFIPDNPHKVIFTTSWASGSFYYWDITQNPPVQISADITGLVFGFQVDMAKAPVPMIDLPPSAQDQVNTATQTLAPGSFTINQLFMDFTDASIDMYDTGTTIWPPNFPAAAKAAFPGYIRTYVEGVASAGGHILGYAVTVNNPGGIPDPIPTFPPTSLNFATNQFQPYPNPKPADLQPDYDTLTYNMMTGGKTAPTFTSWPWMGNFVMPTSGDQSYYGAMLLSNPLIMNQWLQPVLSKLVTSHWVLADTSGSIGPNVKVENGTMTIAGTGLTYTFPTTTGKSERNNTWSADDAYYTMDMSVTAKPSVGTTNPTITIVKNTSWNVKNVHWYGVRGHAAKTTSQVWWACRLEVNIEFVGINDGAIQVNVTQASYPPKNPNILYGDPGGWLITDASGDTSIWLGVNNTIDESMTDAVNLAIPVALPDQLTQALQKQLPVFVVPGGAQLFLGDMGFNDEGDMIVGLSYKS